MIGPCHPLRFGVVDALSAEGVPAVGPTALGATIESSKGWAAELALAAGIPMPATHAFDSADAADAFVTQQDRPYVVKPDGEAFAAAVTVSDSVEDTHAAIDRMSRMWWTYGATDARIVLQERVHGRELHVAALTDGTKHRVLHAVRGYKRPTDGDQGAFTSGMGSQAPVAEWTPDLRADVEARILTPLLAELRRRGIHYSEFIEVGVMLTADGPSCSSSTAASGSHGQRHPPAPALRPRRGHRSRDHGRTRGDRDPEPVGAAVCVMLRRLRPTEPADDLSDSVVIEGLESVDQRSLVFHSETARQDGRWLFGPGAALAVTGIGATVPEARERAYAAVRHINFEGALWRTDIAAETVLAGVPVDTTAAQIHADGAASSAPAYSQPRQEFIWSATRLSVDIQGQANPELAAIADPRSCLERPTLRLHQTARDG